MSEPRYPGAALREKLRGSWRVWRHRWALLEFVGVSEERWQAWPLLWRRAFIAALIGALALVVLAPFSGFDVSALGAYLIFVALYVPSWNRLGRWGRFVIPLAFLALVAGYPVYANRSGLQYISPANTYIGLTHKPALPGEPNKYYPSGKRTYARVVAADDFQGAADVLQLKALGVKSVYVLNDKEAYGFGVASAVKNVANGAKSLGVKVVGFEAWDPKASSYTDLATKIKNSGAGAVFLGGLECENGGKLIKDLRAGLGTGVVLEAPDGFSSFKDTIAHAGSASNGMYISIAGEPYQNLNAAGKKFASQFGKSIGLSAQKVNPYSNYGATAMLVMLKAIATSGGTRAGVSKGVYNHSFSNTPIGNFKLNANGDTNAGVISFYHVKGNNAPFLKIISPAASLVALAKP